MHELLCFILIIIRVLIQLSNHRYKVIWPFCGSSWVFGLLKSWIPKVNFYQRIFLKDIHIFVIRSGWISWDFILLRRIKDTQSIWILRRSFLYIRGGSHVTRVFRYSAQSVKSSHTRVFEHEVFGWKPICQYRFVTMCVWVEIFLKNKFGISY